MGSVACSTSHGSDCHFRSNRGDELRRFQELGYWVREELPVKEAILDGEVVALGSGGPAGLRALMAGQGISTMPRSTRSG